MEGRPQLQCPVKVPCNPHTTAAEQHSLQWALDFHLIPDTLSSREKFKAWRFANLGARANPNCTRAQLDLFIDFLTVLFLYDDMADTPDTSDPNYEKKLRRIEDRFIAVSFGSVYQKTDHSLIAGLADIVRRMQALTHSSWMNRFAVSNREFVLGVRWERATRNDHCFRSLATYTKMRALSVGASSCFELASIFLGNKFSPDLAECPFVKQLLLMAVNHIAWTNDIYSIHREIRNGTTENLVVVLKNEKGCSWAEAIDSAIEMCNSELEAFMRLEKLLVALKGETDIGTAQFLQLLKHFICGHILWCTEDTLRYSS